MKNRSFLPKRASDFEKALEQADHENYNTKVPDMPENIDFLQTHKDSLHLFGFWDEMYKSTVIAAIEARYKPEIRAKYCITDIVINGDNVLLKWNKKPLQEQG